MCLNFSSTQQIICSYRFRMQWQHQTSILKYIDQVWTFPVVMSCSTFDCKMVMQDWNGYIDFCLCDIDNSTKCSQNKWEINRRTVFLAHVTYRNRQGNWFEGKHSHKYDPCVHGSKDVPSSRVSFNDTLYKRYIQTGPPAHTALLDDRRPLLKEVSILAPYMIFNKIWSNVLLSMQ